MPNKEHFKDAKEMLGDVLKALSEARDVARQANDNLDGAIQLATQMHETYERLLLTLIRDREDLEYIVSGREEV